MDCGKIGKLIFTLRREKGLTQKALADGLNISDRTISKWERGIGCPDVSLLPELSAILGVHIEKILLGDLEPSQRDRGNMKNLKFYICPDCKNLLSSTGGHDITCCGRRLTPLTPQQDNSQHSIHVEEIENDYYITIDHEMSKQHFISFVAYATYDRVLLIKLYPEQSPSVRFPKMHGGQLYVCCNLHGLFQQKL